MAGIGMMSRRALVALSLMIASGCARTPQSPTPGSVTSTRADASGLRVLFIGSSLTTEMPELVQAMAAAGGVALHAQAEVGGGFSLSDHWSGGHTRQVLAAERWDYLVLQQGPSTLPESQLDLRTWSVRWADEARRHHVKPALYMVWAFRGQPERFPLASNSYRSAAAAAQAQILPAGEAWQDALRRYPAIKLYGDYSRRAGRCLSDGAGDFPGAGWCSASVGARAAEVEFGARFRDPRGYEAKKLWRSAERACRCGPI